MKKIWVVGSNGQIGSSIIELLKTKKIDFLETNRETGNLLDEKQLWSVSSEVTHIINAAAYARVDLAETNREEAFSINVIGAENLAKIAKNRKAKLIHLSTDYVFDGKLNRPYHEEDEPNPLNWYGFTKREGEIRILKTLPDACIIRISRVFGGPKNAYIAPILKHMYQEKELVFPDDQITRPTYAPDLTEAILSLINEKGIYHFSNSGSLSKYDFTCAIWEWAKKLSNPIICQKLIRGFTNNTPPNIIRPLYTTLDTQKIEKIIKIRPWKECFNEYISKQYNQKA